MVFVRANLASLLCVENATRPIYASAPCGRGPTERIQDLTHPTDQDLLVDHLQMQYSGFLIHERSESNLRWTYAIMRLKNYC